MNTSHKIPSNKALQIFWPNIVSNPAGIWACDLRIPDRAADALTTELTWLVYTKTYHPYNSLVDIIRVSDPLNQRSDDVTRHNFSQKKPKRLAVEIVLGDQQK